MSILCFAQGAQAEDLATKVDTAIAAARARLGAAKVSVHVVEVPSGQEVLARDPDLSLNVASNTKLITSCAAMKTLGPQHSFRTGAFAAAVSDKGVVKGPLFIRGRGDPSFHVQHADDLARRIALAGAKRIPKGIVVDTSFFDKKHLPPHFEEQPDEDASFRAPIFPTALNFNRINLTVAPSDAGPARVTVDPASAYVSVENQVQTVPRGRTRIDVEMTEAKARLSFLVTGRIRRGTFPRQFGRRAVHPALFLGHTLRAALARHGVRVGKRVSVGNTPLSSELLAEHASPPLATVLEGLGKYSNNFVAEMILKVMGAEALAGTRPATWADGLSLVRSFLEQEVGFAPRSYRYENGSGLFDASRFSARQLTTLLSYCARDFRFGPEFVAHLAVAGRDGTLATRMNATAATGVVRAKTGTLAQVSALSGFAGGKRLLAFSILVDGFPRGKTRDARNLQDDIANALAEAAR